MHSLAYENDPKGSKLKVIDVEPKPKISCELINIKDLIALKIENKQRFYSIEVSPLVSVEELNYNKFSVLPLFTSVTWLSDHNLKQPNVSDSDAIKLVKLAQHSTPVLLHLSCYKLTYGKLDEILRNNVKNVLALRGG